MKPHRSIAALAVAVVAFAVGALATAQGLVLREPPSGYPWNVRTASYPLFAVEGSGITGHLQVVEKVQGGTHLVLTVYRLTAGDRRAGNVSDHAAAMYVGSCGPDRPMLLMLEPVGRTNDPFVSLTESTLTFEEVTQGDHFVYVFDGGTIDQPDGAGLDVAALACGEVGQGALAGQR